MSFVNIDKNILKKILAKSTEYIKKNVTMTRYLFYWYTKQGGFKF